MRKPASNKIDFDALCKMAKVKTLSDFEERISMNGSDTYLYVYRQAAEDGKSEREAEEAASLAESYEVSDACQSYYDAVISVFDKVFEKHKLFLTPINSRKRPSTMPFEFRVESMRTGGWREALDCIRHTINGVGLFEFSNVEQLADSIPATYRSAVLSHLHWIVEYPNVYDGTSMRSMIERNMR
jgi:hypothetical protein